MKDEEILSFDIKRLLNQDVILDIYDITDEHERERIKALMMARAKELKLEAEFRTVLKAYDKADKKLADEYTKSHAVKNAKIPIKFDGRGQPLNTIENYLTILRNDIKFQNIRFNLLTFCPEKIESGRLIRWTDEDDAEARRYIENKYKIHSQSKLEDALRIVFREREYHPIKDVVETEKWDKTERIPTFLHKWLKCKDTPYTREVSRLIFSGGINRLYNPGCKFDDVPVLIGTNQGEGKSTFVRWLALQDEFFTEVTEIEGQKGIEAIEGAWICEIAELLALTRTKDVEAVKSYITKQTDRYRKPFDKRVTEHKRQCIFIGTTNKEQFLTDKTGNRRFYPVKVNQNGYDLFENEFAIKHEILQCWAEAKYKYDKGLMLPYADRSIIEQIREEQSKALEDDYRDGLIASYLETKDEVCVLEIWERALHNDFTKPTKKDSNEIALILQSLGNWERQEKASRTLYWGVQKVWKKVQNQSV